MPISPAPAHVLAQSTQVTSALLEQKGVRLLLCDLDYTLAPRSVPRPDETLRLWLADCKAAGVEVMILSNNRSSRRVQPFPADLVIRHPRHARKPHAPGCREAMSLAGVTPERTAMLGDKLLTDILGARRSGVLALMVEPLGGPVGAWNHVLHLLQRPFKAISKRRTTHEQI